VKTPIPIYINQGYEFNTVTEDESLDELLDELESHGDLDKAQQQVSIDVEERRYGKAVTTVSGFEVPESKIESLASSLKSSLATGGTVSDGTIELQGDHRNRLPDLLQEHGYNTV
jgi:translation initiation factor 1